MAAFLGHVFRVATGFHAKPFLSGTRTRAFPTMDFFLSFFLSPFFFFSIRQSGKNKIFVKYLGYCILQVEKPVAPSCYTERSIRHSV